MQSSVPFRNRIALFLSFLFAFLLNFILIDSNDTWWHLRLGEWMFENKKVLTEEIFSSTAYGKEFVAYQWLTQILFHLVAGKDGAGLTYLVCFVNLTAAFAAYRFFFKDHMNHSLGVVLFAMFNFLVAFRGEARPHIFGILFATVLVYVLFRWRKTYESRLLLVFLPVQIIWANMHGSFMLAPAITGIFAVSMLMESKLALFKQDQKSPATPKQLYQIFGYSAVLLLAALINPYGYKLIEKSLVMFFTHGYMSKYVKEWTNILELRWGTWFYVWAAWQIFAAYLVLSKRKLLTTSDAVFCALSFYFPFNGVRYIPLSIILSLPVVTRLMSFSIKHSKDSPSESKIIHRPVIFALIALCIWVGKMGFPQALVAYRTPGVGFKYEKIPLAIFEHAKAYKYKGNVLNHYNEGAYITYYLYPDMKTVMDSRTEVFGEKLVAEHNQAILSAPELHAFVKKYDVDFILINHQQAQLRQYLFDHKEWILEKSDYTHDFFVHESVAKADKEKITRKTPTTDIKEIECLFIRIQGLCFKAPHCSSACQMTDAELAASLGMGDTLCIKFNGACSKQQFACNNCKFLCQKYSLVHSNIKDIYHPKLPDIAYCPLENFKTNHK